MSDMWIANGLEVPQLIWKRQKNVSPDRNIVFRLCIYMRKYEWM